MQKEICGSGLWNAFSEESGKAGLELPAGEAGLGLKTVNIARQ